MTLFVVLIVPGGLMIPLCYAAYAAVAHTASRRASGRHAAIINWMRASQAAAAKPCAEIRTQGRTPMHVRGRTAVMTRTKVIS